MILPRDDENKAVCGGKMPWKLEARRTRVLAWLLAGDLRNSTRRGVA